MTNDKTTEELFGSKAKARVLKLFLHNPQLTFSVDGVAAKTSLKRNEVQKVLPYLIKLGVIKPVKHLHAKNKNTKKKK